MSRSPSRELSNTEASAPAVDTDAVLCHLVLAGLQIAENFLRDLGEVATLDQAGERIRQQLVGKPIRGCEYALVSLEEDLSEARLAERVVLEIEPVRVERSGYLI